MFKDKNNAIESTNFFHIFNDMETNIVLNQIGNTPLVRLKQASRINRLSHLRKSRIFQPRRSVKDRAALFIVQDAIKESLFLKVEQLLKEQLEIQE